jgi:hypothetical protein
VAETARQMGDKKNSLARKIPTWRRR